MRSIMVGLCAMVLVVMTGCGGGTRVVKDGFTARQVTEEPIRFLRSTRSWDSKCRWDQLQMEKASGDWFCPAEADKDAFNTVAYPAKADPSYASAVIPAAIHGAAFLGGMGLLGALMPATQVTQGGQSASSTTTINETFSTKYIGK